MASQADERDLLLAVIEQESEGIHWNNWEVTISRKGAIGFLQVMPFNSERYNDNPNANPIIAESINLYRPDENLKAAAQLLNEYLDKAFAQWEVNGDDDDDVLAKALARYNGKEFSALREKTWEEICRGQLIKLESLRFAVQIRDRLGLEIEDFEEPYR